MKFGSRSVDATLAGQLDGRRPQLVGYGALPLTILSPLFEAGTDFVNCEYPVIVAHCLPPPGITGIKNDVNNYAGQVSCRLAESSQCINLRHIKSSDFVGLDQLVQETVLLIPLPAFLHLGVVTRIAHHSPVLPEQYVWVRVLHWDREV